jgi:threonine synthase
MATDVAPRPDSQSPPSLWRYAALLPDVAPVTLGEGWTPLVRSRRYPGLYIKREGANPTGGFESRTFSIALSLSRHAGITQLESRDPALAPYAAAAGLQAVIEVLENSQLMPWGPNRWVWSAGSFGARLSPVRLRVETEFAHAYRLGLKTMVWEMVEQLGWELPHVVLSRLDMRAATGEAIADLVSAGWIAPAPAPDVIVVDPHDQTTSQVESTRLTLLEWAREEALLLSGPACAAVSRYLRMIEAGRLRPETNVVAVDPFASWKRMVSQLPDSYPRRSRVGGIITPV